MLISHSRKFIFIHVYKVAGTSIGNALNKYCDYSSEYKNPIKKLAVASGLRPSIYSKDFNGHITATELRERIPARIFENYFKFAFVRNPWDWQVSLFEYAKQTPRHQEYELTNSFKNFDEYIKWRINGNFNLQKDFISDKNGKLIVDFIGRIENLQEDFQKLCKTLKINNITLPHSNSSLRKDYRGYYSKESKSLVEKTFAEDIKLFGYTF